MPHVVEPLFDVSFAKALSQLEEAQAYLVRCAQESLRGLTSDGDQWGAQTKRLIVDLSGNGRPNLIGKSDEKFIEVTNITATIERLIPAIQWFSNSAQYQSLMIRECHPSTSDSADGNDLVLVDLDNSIKVRCEVSDVVSSSAGSNQKEKKEIASLGCTNTVPDDSIGRYICTAPEFAAALTKKTRRWNQLPYKYDCVALGDSGDTQLLRVIPAAENAT